MVAASPFRRAVPHWVLVPASVLFGVCAASALFVGVWRHEAGRAKAADSALVRAQAEAEAAGGTLVATRKELRRTRAESRRQAEILARLPAAGKPILAEAGRLEQTARQLASDGSALSESVTRLTNAVAALNLYLKQTVPAELDPAYVEAQLSYLEESLAALRTRSDTLAGGAGALAATRQALVKKTAALGKLAEG